MPQCDTTKHGFRITNVNEKMGPSVLSFSLPPVKTCARDVPCRKDCYALGMCRSHPNVLRTWETNLLLLTEEWGYQRMADDVVAYLRLFPFPMFRWFVGGDIANESMMAAIVKVAERVPETRFMLFTKKYDLVDDWELPSNLHVILSVWKGFRPSEDMMGSFPLAYYDDGTPECGIPDGAFVCPGKCPECGYRCWNADNDYRVVFPDH
jgi:hypothetical protein